MSDALTGKTPANSYKQLLQVANADPANPGIDGTLRPISDGDGTDSALSVSTDAARIKGPLDFTGTDHGGVRLNNLTATQRDALTPEKGVSIFNTTTNQQETWNGTAWVLPTGPQGPAGASGHGIVVTTSSSAPGSPSVGDVWIVP